MDCLHWHMPAFLQMFTAGWSEHHCHWRCQAELLSSMENLNPTPRPWNQQFSPLNICHPQRESHVRLFDPLIFSGKFLVAGHLLTPAVLSLTLPQFEIQRSRCHSAVLFYRIFYCKYLHYKFVCSPNGPLGFMKHWIHGADLLSIVSASEQQVVFLLLLNWNDKQIPTRTFLPGLFAILFVLIQDSQKHLEDSAKSKIRTT